ncbi:MAG TPA: hypothetical protein VH592_20400 [Gemmataceae bacterium]|jgi:hypothetical protein
MSYRKPSSTSVRWFRPTLERLEDRIVPSGLDDLLNNLPPSLKELGKQTEQVVGNIIVGQITSHLAGVTSNEVAGEFWIQQVNFATTAFNKAPNLNNLNQLEFDTVQLVNSAILSSVFVDELSSDANLASGTGLSFLQEKVINLGLSGLQAESGRLMQAARIALGNFFQAAAILFGGGQASLPTIPAATSPTGGGYGASYSDAPGTASASGPSVTETAFVTASAGNSAPIAVRIQYSANDGTTGDSGVQYVAPGTSQTVSLTMMPCSAGVTGNWTVTIDGSVDHSATTVFTP